MRCSNLCAGNMRDRVEHWRLTLERVGGGHRRSFEQRPELWCSFEERPPVNRITGEALTQSANGQLGCRIEADLQPEDRIVRNGKVWRVIGPVEKSGARFVVWHLQQLDDGQMPGVDS